MSGIFGCGSRRNSAILSAFKPGMSADRGEGRRVVLRRASGHWPRCGTPRTSVAPASRRCRRRRPRRSRRRNRGERPEERARRAAAKGGSAAGRRAGFELGHRRFFATQRLAAAQDEARAARCPGRAARRDSFHRGKEKGGLDGRPFPEAEARGRLSSNSTCRIRPGAASFRSGTPRPSSARCSCR